MVLWRSKVPKIVQDGFRLWLIGQCTVTRASGHSQASIRLRRLNEIFPRGDFSVFAKDEYVSPLRTSIFAR
jgi:hypothetical protein